MLLRPLYCNQRGLGAGAARGHVAWQAGHCGGRGRAGRKRAGRQDRFPSGADSGSIRGKDGVPCKKSRASDKNCSNKLFIPQPLRVISGHN